MADSVTILEVGARDGLQNEKTPFSIDQKVELITRAMAAGITRLEVGSFVNPKAVPQMADSEAVIAALPDDKSVEYIGLVLNKRGYLRALETREGGKRGVDEVGAVCVASDTFATKNQGQTSQESVDVSADILKLAKRDGISAQVTISAAFGCPFEGKVEMAHVVDMARQLAEAEPREIAIADTIGVGVPGQVTELVRRIREVAPGIPLRVHFHNTRNTAVANAWAAYQAGVEVIDASMGGLGGCPFAPKATGNVATEDVVYMFEQSGVATGVDLQQFINAADWLQGILGRPTPAMVSQAGGFPAGEAA